MKQIKDLLCSFFILMLSVSAFSQNLTLSGTITDENSGENIIGAIIFDVRTGNFINSNSYGFYTISFSKQGFVELQISKLGFQTITRKIALKSDTILNFQLSENNQIDEVIIQAKIKKSMGIVDIPVNQINTLPLIGAEPDLIKAFQLMPGIQSGNEGSSGLYVRGGSPDQNLILLDDVPLYYVNHLGGFISIFNSDIINNVKLIKGNYPARYGGRLSSVLDVRMKEGNMKKMHYNYTIGTLTSKVFFETPIKKDKSSFLFSARGLLWGFLWQPVSKLILKDVSVGYNFYDINSKYNLKINDKNRIFVSVYIGDDNLKFKVKDKPLKASYLISWGNILSSFRWNKVFSKKLFSNLTLAYSRYKYLNQIKSNDTIEDITSRYFSQINDFSLKYDFNYFPAENYTLNFGVQAIKHTFNPGTIYESFSAENSIPLKSVTGNNYIRSAEGSFYLENKISINNFADINAGIRITDNYVEKTHFFSIEPRISADFYPASESSFKLSYTETGQNIHLMTSSNGGLPADIWVPATVYAPPEKAKQFSAGFYKILPKKNMEFTIEVYFKNLNRLIAYKEGINFKAATTSWENKIEINGKGQSYGIEVLFQKKIGKTTGWVAYTFSKTNRQFENINNGKVYPFKYDRTHDISIVVSKKINKHITLSASWVFGSGYPYNLPLNKYISAEDNDEIFNWAERNSFRMRNFHRLNLGAFFTKHKKYGRRIWSINIYNAYNRQNPYYYYLSDEYGTWKLYQQSLFPIIPSISYSFKF